MRLKDEKQTWVTLQYVAIVQPPSSGSFFMVWMQGCEDGWHFGYNSFEAARLDYERLITALTDLEG